MRIGFGMTAADMVKLALTDEKVKPYLDGKQVVKVVVIPDRLVNIVVR